MADTMVCRETYGSHTEGRYVKQWDGSIKRTERNKDATFTGIRTFVRDVFLPLGYPESVSEDYMSYQLWDTLQAFCSTIIGTLATHAMLKGAGVGDETATATAATITWLLKDGTSMAGRIMFAWYNSSNLDCDCKKWRLFADILNDTAFCVQILAPAFSRSLYTLIACISGLCFAIVGLVGGATRAALTMHQARRNNMADVSAKDGSQETMVNLAGLLVSLMITPIVAGHTSLTWSLFLLAVTMHIYANFRAVKSVVMETFNQARFHIVCQAFLDCNQQQINGVMNPAVVNPLEPVIWSQSRPFTLHLGVQLSRLLQSSPDLDECLHSNDKEHYLMGFNNRKGEINVVLHHNATAEDVIKACFQAEIVMFAKKQASENHPIQRQAPSHFVKDLIDVFTNGGPLSNAECWQVIRLANQTCNKLFPTCIAQMQQAGWITSHTLLGPDEWRATWSDTGLEHEKIF
ncbi:RUS family member 1-like [Amphiura filiformis]|uniref:RUS family member 1-like n=1 Tax=Amphiura filiformis TaxID=82378 RepID=UPI003B217B53